MAIHDFKRISLEKTQKEVGMGQTLKIRLVVAYAGNILTSQLD